MLTRARLGLVMVVLPALLGGACTHDYGGLGEPGAGAGAGGGRSGGSSGAPGGGGGNSGTAGRSGSGGTAAAGSTGGGAAGSSGTAGTSGAAGSAGAGGTAAGGSTGGTSGVAGHSGAGGTASGGSGAGGGGAGSSGAAGGAGAGGMAAGGSGAGGAPMTCTPSKHFCDGNTVRTCSADGTTSTLTTTCASTAYCDPTAAACRVDVCTPGQPACDGYVATTCNAAGSGYTGTRTDCSATSEACLSGACDAETVDAVGGSGYYFQQNPNLYAFSVFYVADDCTLTGVEQDLDVLTSQFIRFLVYKSPTEFGDYSNIASYAVTPSLGQGYVSSGPTDVPLVGGNYYMIGVWWGSGNEEYSWDAGGATTTSFGHSIGVALISSAGVLSDLNYPSVQQQGVLRQRLHTVKP